MVVIKTFTTPGGQYVYDRGRNSIIPTSTEDFVSFMRIEAGVQEPHDLQMLQRYQEKGYFVENRLQEVVHSATQHMRSYLNSHISQFTLQVSQFCNLNCSYCAYSGNYAHQRTHSQETMSIEVMKKSIDFFMARSWDVDEVVISFYGGEPLLEIDLIKSSLTYIDEVYKGRAVRYVLTTNGTLLTDDVIQFFIENNFNVAISLDGPKELHDKNRVYSNGKGSFDDIMQNCAYIKEHYPSFFSKLSFLSIVAPGVDFACVNEFFDADVVLNDSVITTNIVNDIGSTVEVMYDDLYLITSKYQTMKTLMAELGMYSSAKTSKLFITTLSAVNNFYKSLSKGMGMYDKAHPSGPCLPGVMRPFVSADGSIYPCERVAEGSDIMKIGHIDIGFDFDKIDAQLNVGKITEEECKACWAFLHCNLCCVASDGGTEMSREMRLRRCEGVRNNVLSTLSTTCLFLESGYDFERKTTMSMKGD